MLLLLQIYLCFVMTERERERDFMLSLSDNNQAYVIEAFNSTSRYLDNYFYNQLLNGIEDSTRYNSS